MRKPDFNGPGRELQTADYLEESVYCVNCGSIFVSSAPKRTCPACTLAKTVEALQDRIETLEEQLAAADGGER